MKRDVFPGKSGEEYIEIIEKNEWIKTSQLIMIITIIMKFELGAPAYVPPSPRFPFAATEFLLR